MKNFKDIIFEKLRVTTNDKANFTNFKIEKITSKFANVLTLIMRDIPFYTFDYENYIENILNSDINICENIKEELYSNYSNLKKLLPKFLNIILTIMNTSKSDRIKYNIQQFVKKINKFISPDKELLIKINYSYLGIDSERYILVFSAKEDNYTVDDILNLIIEK